jgi:tetratricopeptide (TPR) repeat protein
MKLRNGCLSPLDVVSSRFSWYAMNNFFGILFLLMVLPMTNSDLSSGQNFSGLFRHYVLANTQYWQEYVTQRSTDIAALDRERDRILKAISFALDLEAAWPCVYQVIVTFSSFMERRGYWESWNRLLNQALKTAQRLEDVTRATTLSALLARLLQRQSRIEPAILQHRHTIRLARQTGNRFEEARACTNLGFLYIEQGQWYRAEVLCCHALNIFESINSNHGRAHSENHLGFLYTRQCLWDKAQQHLERACTIWQSMGDNHGLMRGFINLSSLYNEMEYGRKSLNCLNHWRENRTWQNSFEYGHCLQIKRRTITGRNTSPAGRSNLPAIFKPSWAGFSMD